MAAILFQGEMILNVKLSKQCYMSWIYVRLPEV